MSEIDEMNVEQGTTRAVQIVPDPRLGVASRLKDAREAFAAGDAEALREALIGMGRSHVDLQIPVLWGKDARHALDAANAMLDEAFESRRDRILAEIAAERVRQDAKWGEQNHPSIPADCDDLSLRYNVPDELACKMACEQAVHDGDLTWGDIALEEYVEALEAPDEAKRRAELVQLAAVVAQWIECIDRNAAREGVTDASAG